MTIKSKWLPKIDLSEANFLSAGIHLLSTSFAVSSLLSSEWVIVENDEVNATTLDEPYRDQADKCLRIGCRDFWRPARFGGYVDQHGHTNVAFHSGDRVLVNCISPLVANLFYALIALCFVISITSFFACVLNLIPPPTGFLVWLRRNTILEMCNMMLTLFACVAAIIAQSEVADLRPEDEVSIGSGVFLISLSGIFNFFAAILTLKHTNRINRMRRLDNQRLLCARSLRSWREAARRPDDARPIMDFERYLDSATSLEEFPPSTFENERT